MIAPGLRMVFLAVAVILALLAASPRTSPPAWPVTLLPLAVAFFAAAFLFS